MTNNPNEIESQIVEGRRRIAAAQVAIAKTLGMVKRQVRETVADARLAANDIGANVKDTMSAAALRRSFNVSNQTRRHPWQTVGSAVLFGYLIGSIRTSGSRRYVHDNADSHHVQHGHTRGILPQFGGEINSLRRAAMRAIIKRSIKSVMHSVLAGRTLDFLRTRNNLTDRRPENGRIIRTAGNEFEN
jgi:ElaB/YqjD/DUF883 family membrane-anchored ribosome-binding protein